MIPNAEMEQTKRDILLIDAESIRSEFPEHHLLPLHIYALGRGEYEGKVFSYRISARLSDRQNAERLARMLTVVQRKIGGPDDVVVVGVDIDEDRSRCRRKVVFDHSSLGFWGIEHDLSSNPIFMSWMKGEEK